MADDTEEIDRDGPGDVAAAPPPTVAPATDAAPFSIRAPAPTIDHGRALGFSRRGTRVPSGTTTQTSPAPLPVDAPDQTAPAEVAVAPTPGMPSEPVAADRSERHAAARAALEQQARDAWKQAYSSSQPVNANGPIITPKQYRDAELAADRSATESAAEQNYSRKTKNATWEAQMRASGQRYYVDGAGQVQPMLEPKSNRPLFHATPWEEGTDPKTGETTLTKTDIYGQRQYKRPQMVAPADTSDNNLYYKMPDGTLTAAGDIDKLTKHADPQVARTALRAVHARNSAMWKEAITPMEEAASQATAAHDAAQQQSLGIQAQIDDTNQKLQAIDTNTMGQTEGGILGIGAKPTAAATAETNKQNALLSQLDQYNKQKAEIDDTTKTGGSLWQSKRMATLNLGLFKAKASHDNYLDLATERRLILKAQGKPEQGDPILASILQAQQTYGNAVTKYSTGMQQSAVAPPRVSHDELVKTSGTRLDVGAPVPGQPGVFQSLAAPPHGNDPVVDPDNPNAAPPPPSKFTMVGQSATSPAPAQPPALTGGTAAQAGPAAPPPVPGAPVAQPAGSPAGKIDPALASEPFAQAARGVKNIGEVSMKDMAARYGSGQGPVQPNSLVKIKNRLDDINATLNDPDTIDKVMAGAKGSQIDGKLRANLQKEQDYLTSLSTQRFARLSPADQQRVTETTRDPTFWDKIKGAGKSMAEAAATGGAGVLKGTALAGNYLPDSAGGAGNIAASLAAPEQVMAATKADPLYKMGSFIDEAAKETYAKNPHENEGMVSQALNEAAKGAGGFAPLVASGPAAPLTIGLQTAGEQMEPLYQEAISKGATPEMASKIAVKRALLSGGVQAALFALLPKPLQKVSSKLIVDKIAGGALMKFLANRLAQGTEGAILGGASAAGANLAEGRPVGEGVPGAAAGLGAMQAFMPREPGARPEARPGEAPGAPAPVAPTDVSPQDAARADLNAKLAAEPAAPEPFKPTGEGVPKSAAESAKTLVPEAAKIAADRPPPAKSAEESALAFKAHEELNRRAAAKEEGAQKLVDQIQEATGKSRGEILATRAGKDIDVWHDELKKEAAYQKNPLVIDPERRATELRGDLKKLDEEWQDHVTKSSQEAEAAAEIQKLKDSQPAKSAEEASAEAARQKTLGVEGPEAKTQARHDDLTARREAIENELTAADQLRKSPQGAEKLAEDLGTKGEKQPRKETEAARKSEAKPAPEETLQNTPAAEDAGKYGERVPVVGVEDPVKDRARYEQIQKELIQATRDGDETKRNALFQENEDIKNRNSSSPGMPPEPITTEEKSNATDTGQKPQGSESEHPRVPPGTDVPAHGEQVREGQGEQAGGGGGTVAGKKVRQPKPAPREETVREKVVPANKHGEVEGDKINKEWTEFHPESKGLGVPREEMPQVKAEHRGALTQFLKGQGIESKPQMVRPTDLKPTQNEYSQAKVEKARAFEGGDRSILVSSDNHIVDGHHQWVAALHDEPNKPMKVIRLDAPIKDLLGKVKEFPSAEAAEGATAPKSEPEPKVAAKAATPESTVTEPEVPRRSMDDDTRKPPAMMTRAERMAELKEAGVKEVNGKSIKEANPAEIINAVGKLRRGQLGVTDEPKALSQKLIDALEKAKINKTGEGKVRSADPLSVAYDSALDLAILGVKAGRELAHMVKLAVTRLKAAYPGATKADEARLEKAIRDAHASVHGTDETPAPTTPKAKVEQKATEVISSPKVEKTQNKIVKAWNDARDGANLRDTLAYTNEAAETSAKQTGHEAQTTVANQINRDLDLQLPKNPLDLVGRKKVMDERGVAADALGMHIEAGKDGVKGLAEMKAKLEASTKADPKWKTRAIAAIDYASKNYDKLQKSADLYRGFTDAQQAREEQAGMPTLKRSDYVPHQQDIDDGTWLENLLGGGSGGNSSTGSSSRKNRVFDTHADSIAAGIDPKSLNALDLLRNRVTAGETGVNLRQWQDSLHNYIDPKSGQPIAMKAIRVERPDGSFYYDEPKGYKNEMLGNQPVLVKKEYKGILSDLTSPSWFSQNDTRKTLQKMNAFGKSVNLLIDTFHLGRLAIQQSLIKTASLNDFHAPAPSYKEGLNILDRSPDEMRTMAKNGEIAPEQLPDLLEKKGKLNLLTSAGLNTGHIADAMHQEFIRSIPGIGDINKFIFEKFQRGAMAETALMEFDRQSKMFSDLKPHEVARQVAKDINTRFGNLGKQGWMKSRTAQDIARMIWLAPQWNEGLIKSEVGGVRQIGQAAIDAARGKRFAMGMLGRQMISGTLSIFAANQIINQMTRGKFTWENPEEEWGSKLSAWIPDKVGGKSSGYFLNPLGVTAEITHQLLTRYERSGEPWTPFVEYFRGRASAVTRPLWVMFTGKDGMGNTIRPGDRGKEALKASVPAPIGASAVGSAIKGAVTGGNTEVFPGQFQKQAMQSFGVKTDTAPSPEQRIGALAERFNKTKNIQPSAEFYPTPYKDMVAALRRNNPNDIKNELELLSEKKTPEEITKYFRSWQSHPFTGQRNRETEFVRTLTPEQRGQYVKAQQTRKLLGGRALQAISRMPPKLQRTGTD